MGKGEASEDGGSHVVASEDSAVSFGREAVGSTEIGLDFIRAEPKFRAGSCGRVFNAAALNSDERSRGVVIPYFLVGAMKGGKPGKSFRRKTRTTRSLIWGTQALRARFCTTRR
jgi:hypothetical protein